jgi:short-subunit dehydrogenase
MTRRLALITGASAGIGAAFARVFAERGYDLALTARRADRLEALAEETRAKTGAEAMVIAADLAKPDAVDAILAEIAAKGRVVDTLVNNAGYGLPGAYAATTWADQAAFLQVMATAPSELAHKVLPGMLARRFGRIVNVASLAGLIPGSAGHTLYGATKAYLIRFSQSLWAETRGTGVHVSALCPGFTYSEFHDVNGTREGVSRMPDWMWQDARTVAEIGFQGVEADRACVVSGAGNKAIATVAKLIPDALGLKLVAGQSAKFRRLE